MSDSKAAFFILAIISITLGLQTDRIIKRLDSIDTSLQILVGTTAQSKAHDALAGIFKQHGSPEPVEMAKAVMSTNNPALLAAVAIVESNGNTQAIGDNGKSTGAFQVQNRYWGDVPDNPDHQAQQAQAIIDGLLDSRRCLWRALQYYNGGRSGSTASAEYADRVIKLRDEIELSLIQVLTEQTVSPII